MKIQNNNIGGPNLEKADKAAALSRSAAERTGEAGRGTAGDQIDLSALSQQVRTLAADSPEREHRLEALAAAVSAGTYRADPAEVSRRLVAEALAPDL